MTFYCPKCWREIQERAERCPFCGYDLNAHEALSYEDKLLAALSHPIRENRRLAIQTLGDLRHRRAAPRLASILREEQDYYVLRETLIALFKMNTAETRALVLDAAEHPSRLVRNFARELMSQESVAAKTT